MDTHLSVFRILGWITFILLVIQKGRSQSLTTTNQCSNQNDFPCRSNNRTCIPRVKWQDGQVDCPDGSDEECLEWQYDCKFGKPKCVSLYNFMDGVIDCASGFDEACPAHYFVCMDRSDCIDPKRYLDGRKDCADGSDEPCPSAHFLCHDRSKCVEMQKFQDGHADCPDGSDEECTLFQIECLCGTPRCIDIRRYNDSYSDCEDGSDEPSLVLDNNLLERKCSDGQQARNSTNRHPTPPPGAPMVPCGPEDLNLCSEEMNEMCLIIAGAARCVCQMGSIRPPGSAKCIPAPTRIPIQRPSSRLPVILTNKDKLTTVLPVLREGENSTEASCSTNDANSCPNANEICTKTQGLFACVCDKDYARDPVTGRCAKLVDECSDPKLNVCDIQAVCMDNPISFECLCKEGYLDMSSRPQTEPGRHCVPLVNECNNSKSNECDKTADCIDLPSGYTCRCKSNFRDVSPNPNRFPGRKCVSDVNECEKPSDNECHKFTTCTDLTDGYQCRCKEGYVDVSPDSVVKPGRDCKEIVNECQNATLNDCDKSNGECIDTLDSFVCRCKQGFIDELPSKPGRQCTIANNPCLDPTLNDCDPNAVCNSAGPTLFECTCPSGFADVSPDVKRPGRLCRQSVDECTLGTHRCDPNAVCTDTPDSYVCKCPDGWRDASPDRKNLGRTCEKTENECSDASKNDCAKDAVCQDTADSFVCQCKDGFFDLSARQQKAQGRICQALKDECKDKTADCSADAECLDSAEAYLCRCKSGFKDESSDPINRPGRRCTKSNTVEPLTECDVNDPLTCNKDLFEVCIFLNSTYRCACPKDVSRLGDGRCKVINECSESRLNDCHQDAVCLDTVDSYNCQCRAGYADLSEDITHKPGRMCKELINECTNPQRFKVDCHENSVCQDTNSSYTCNCGPGFADVSERYGLLPGRKCVIAVNECLNATINKCSANARCEDAKEGYTCRCKEGFIDVSPNVTHYPGRICNPPNLPENNTATKAPFIIEQCDPKVENRCGRGEVCVADSSGNFICQCAQDASRFEDGTCTVFKACDNPQNNDCDKNSICSNVFGSYECQCKPEFLDVSPDPIKKPGRKCKELINECADPSMNDCSVFSNCIDTRESFACVCRNGYVDVSSQFSLSPGRKCQNTSNECSVRTLNTCDDNADCVDIAEGYTCQCAPGFVDVSSAADLPPGRVCTVQTSCPKQLTDLMFLVDGSGSIGSFVFKTEVLRFVREFVSLFDIGQDQTRVGMIQFSDQIRHEFELGQYKTKAEVEKAVTDVAYLTGLTRTGAAITDMVNFGFAESRGSRPISLGVHRVAIVITDGRSQDNVTLPALDARRANILIFAVGVTDHVLESELVQISGDRQRTFVVEQFTDLNTRLRSLIQKAACPPTLPPPVTKPPGCDPSDLNACDRTRNEICIRVNSAFVCGCPEEFERHPASGVCGGDLCNFQLRTTCPDPELCRKTPFGTFRCVCPSGSFRLAPTGVCFSSIGTPPPQTPAPNVKCKLDDPSTCGTGEICVKLGDRQECQCQPGLIRQPITNICAVFGWCDPRNPSCDSRRREQCLPDGLGNFVCQCPPKFERDPVTRICLINECKIGTHDCDKNGVCTDTAESFICQCPDGYLDESKDPQRPGRSCRLVAFVTDLCEQGKHNCSVNAICIPVTATGSFTCQCKPNYVDFSPNPQQFGGVVCKEKENECTNGKATCHPNATCIDTDESYICICKPGFMDKLGLTNPGRACEPFNVNIKCTKGNNDCDPNARCIPQGASDFVCVCPVGYRDKSPNIQNRPGRLCIPLIPECDNPALNDCDKNAYCFEQEDGYTCACKVDFVDISHDVNKPGRLCKKLVDECLLKLDDCARDSDGGICEDTADSYACRCRPGFTDLSPDPINRPGRVCRPIRNKCAEGLHDCSPHASCVDTGDSFTCLCSPGFYDVSTDPVNRPGRSCLRLINECENVTLNDCSPNAWCNDTIQSYRCQCRTGFIDESPDQLNRPGRLCRPRQVNECLENLADCSVNAECIDLDEGFSCQCRPGFIDESPNRITLPGRVCVPMPPSTPKPECRIETINSCNVNLNEVCRIVNSQPKCVCPERFSRNSQTNACTVIDECKYFDLNDCSQNADCIDELDGYTCKCRQNFREGSTNPGRPGRICQPLINECQFPHLNDCHQNAICTDLENSFSCKCKDGFIDMSPDPVNRPGRICHQNVDECRDPNLNTCDQNARCIDEPFGYRCECKDGFLDISPTPTITGRACKLIINECLNKKDNDCDPIALCTDTRDSYRCECPANSTDISPNPAFPGRVCHIDVDACRQNLNDCDKNAICRSTGSSFTCECASGFIDRSPNPLRPGRVCLALVNECTDGSATCSPNANCRDLDDGYTCECKTGFVDRSPVRSQPGRVCTRPEICPSNHDCSAAAICEPLENGGFTCRCIPGYEDESPNDKPGRVCIRGDKCRDARLNNCSRNAICFALVQGYRCECVPGFIDKSPDQTLPGRVCEPATPAPPPTKHPCQDPSLNDCSLSGNCRGINDTRFTCECRPGFVDRSPDPVNKPGRVCVPQPPVCFDSSQNDCHPFAICEQVDDGRRFICRCRDGYVDTSPDQQKPGRICREKINECLDASKNDCAPQAICEDLDLGFTCHCPAKFKDTSPDPKNPGRQCFGLINECLNPQLNNCSRFADCTDLEAGYKCQCKEGYFDNDQSSPGRQCAFIINECEFPNLNDCDSHANCTDLPGGYTCKCPPPYVDKSPDVRFPGRICLLDECETPQFNDCHRDAVCQDTPTSFVCFCKEGFDDVSADPRKPGRNCQRVLTTQRLATTTTSNPDAVPCGQSRFCLISLNERCVGGVRCECPQGTNRRAVGLPCVEVIGIQLPLRVIRRNEVILSWASAYGNPNDRAYIEITDMFNSGIAKALNSTSVAPFFITASTDAITHPRLYNASWNNGLMFNFTVYVTPNSVEPKQIWQEMLQAIVRTNYSVGGTELFIDEYQIDPFVQPPPPGQPCGDNRFCDPALGEVCIGGKICACPIGKGRREPNQPCTDVVGFTLPLWVFRRNEIPFHYNNSFIDTNGEFYKRLVETFVKGCSQAYSKTQLWSGFIGDEVRDILDPQKFNASWDQGCMFNFTVYFEKGYVTDARRCWNELIQSCKSTNFSLGGTELFINPLQPDPFSICFKNDCHPKASCIERSSNSYTCKCSDKYRDLDATNPGRRCIAEDEFDECAHPGDNECSPNADCIDESHLYRCVCKKGYVDLSPSNGLKGRICEPDYCLDVPFCPANTSCANVPEIQGARCQCHAGFIDIKPSPHRLKLFGENVFCLANTDVNECAMELTNCSSVATCIDLEDGYTCSCPAGYSDAQPSIPGRICAGASCGMCNEHGDCVPQTGSREVKCRCHTWYTGEFCDRDARIIMAIILAILFLLTSLCCLLWFCCKCRCAKGRGLWYREPLFTYRKRRWPWSTLEASSSSESGGELHSGMSTSAFGKGSEYYPDLAIPRAKLKQSSGNESSSSHHHVSQAHFEQQKLSNYLHTDSSDSAIKIPRAKLNNSGASTVERDGSDSVIFSDVHHALPPGASIKTHTRYSDSESENSSTTSSDYTLREEIERRVITDTKRTETSKTITAEIHKDATAEFHVYPPIDAGTVRTGRTLTDALRRLAVGKKQSTKKQVQSESQKTSSSAANVQEQMRDSKEIYESLRYPGATSIHSVHERDRGQSLAEVSVAGIQGRGSEWGVETATTFSQPRAMSEYTERDLESISEESQLTTSSDDVQNGLYDKKVLVKKSHDFQPDQTGRGGTERYKTEVSSKVVKSESKHL